MSILAYLRGPAGSSADYIHSEGCCCQSEATHKSCKVDLDYTLRNALTEVQGSPCLVEWCGRCLGMDADCLVCHTSAELNSGQAISQRQKALAALCTGWSGGPPRSYWIAAGIAF